jgi:FKBP-type peptidyl-prolyl cis-trans isomerase SlyD
MLIENNRVVSLSYELHVEEEDGSRQLRDKATAESPLQFLFGVGQLLPLFESNIKGLKEGDHFQFTIPYVEGYGEYDENALAEVPKQAFSGIEQPLDEFLEVGLVLPMRDQDGNEFNGEIIEVMEDSVLMDFNHPLAGVDLHFSGSITGVRLATPDEIAHGHVHGPGGHQH